MFQSHIRALAKIEMTPKVKKRSKNDFEDTEYIRLFEKFHIEYRMDFDAPLLKYYHNMSLENNGPLCDVEAFDLCLPPQSIKNYQYYQN